MTTLKPLVVELSTRADILALMMATKEIATRRDIAEFRKKLQSLAIEPPVRVRGLKSNWAGNKYS